eukprot:m.19843 g.19843  ORF g.19843 m.19843 type:complete len:70 (+) comp31381_c0_seq3:100-309(+)
MACLKVLLVTAQPDFSAALESQPHARIDLHIGQDWALRYSIAGIALKCLNDLVTRYLRFATAQKLSHQG